jgi:large subunit ribosomal protein L15
MDLSRLKPAKGSNKREKRVGRGEGSRRGGTSTRGHKGHKSRSGYSQKVAFEGGQMPYIRRVPKFGFTNRNRVEYRPVNLYTLEDIAKKFNVDKIDLEILRKAGVISKHDKVKILGRGQLTLKLEVQAHAFSKSAKEAIEKQNGTVNII